LKLLFVYGTLKKHGQKVDISINNLELRFVGYGRIEAELFDLGDYPGAIDTKSVGNYVYGEVYKINQFNEIIKKLDEYEDYYPNDPDNSLFIRKITTVEMEEGKELIAFVYFYNQDVSGNKRILSGKWND
jgi:gamma-glutamylcyclotransferase (GGCT)/AIG2-like uncharacterized protein YtfP